MTVIANEEAREHLLQSLHHALGDVVLEAMRDPGVVEIMVNPDGKIWTDRTGEGRSWTGAFMAPNAAERILRTLATHAGVVVTADRPRVSASLPGTGERFQGALPPLAAAPTFAIRKRPAVIFPLSGRPDGYVENGVLSADQAAVIRQAVIGRRNIVVAGGTGSGKTTLLNAILAEEAFRSDRVVIIEDTRELQCAADDCVQLLTKPAPNSVSMADLVFDVLRLRPDRIIGGEVRDGAAALNLLKAWNTGHPGGCTSLHANSAREALHRFEELIGEVSAQIPYRAIGQSIDLVVFIERTPSGRRVTEIIEVKGFEERYLLTSV